MLLDVARTGETALLPSGWVLREWKLPKNCSEDDLAVDWYAKEISRLFSHSKIAETDAPVRKVLRNLGEQIKLNSARRLTHETPRAQHDTHDPGPNNGDARELQLEAQALERSIMSKNDVASAAEESAAMQTPPASGAISGSTTMHTEPDCGETHRAAPAGAREQIEHAPMELVFSTAV
jgi:hypothetical protein